MDDNQRPAPKRPRKPKPAPHSTDTTARDVLELSRELRARLADARARRSVV